MHLLHGYGYITYCIDTEDGFYTYQTTSNGRNSIEALAILGKSHGEHSNETGYKSQDGLFQGIK